MKPITLFCVLLVIAVVVALALKARRRLAGPAAAWPFYAKRLLSQPEQILYYRLLKALPEHIVLAQVQVSRVLGVKKGFNFHQWNNRINRLSYDFVVCSKDFSVLAAVELDDKSHEGSGRRATDAKMEKATAAAGVRLLRWHVKSLPDEATIQAAFKQQQLSDPAAVTESNRGL